MNINRVLTVSLVASALFLPARAGVSIYQLFPFGGVKKVTRVGNPLRLPPELQQGESLVFNSANMEVWPGTTTQILGLNNSYPAATIRVQKGDNFSVLFERSVH